MLNRLFLKNILFIDEIDIDFNNGFSVLTGETGSGKSVILQCIKIALGEKIPTSFLSDKTSSVYLEFNIEGSLELQNKLKDYDIDNNLLTIRRSFGQGKVAKLFVNDIPSNVSFMKLLVPYLLEYQGQHSQALILDKSKHIEILDQYAGHEELLFEIKTLHEKFSIEQQKLSELNSQIFNRSNEQEYFEHVVMELENISPKTGEETELIEQRRAIVNQQKLQDTISDALAKINKSDIEIIINQIYKSLSRLSIDDNQAHDTQNELQIIDRISIEIDELKNSLDEKLANIQVLEVEDIESRLFLLREMARKYRVTPDELGQVLIEKQQQLSKLQLLDSMKAESEKAVLDLKKAYLKLANKLSENRKKAAIALEQQIMSELKTLNMAKTTFKIDVVNNINSLSSKGVDKVEFLISSNPGFPLKPLKDIASGGELSRFMLAIRVILTKLQSPPTVVFDEIDTGLGGAVADAVGKKLHMLSLRYQIFVITHHPQVAAKAKSHYLIEKQYCNNNQTKLYIKNLKEDGRKLEIARMLSGKTVSSEAVKAAEILLANSKN